MTPAIRTRRLSIAATNATGRTTSHSLTFTIVVG